MRKRSKKRTIISLSIAGGLLLVLIAAGATLRMKTDELEFFPALGIFLKETFTFSK